jgi:hypothetical protein
MCQPKGSSGLFFHARMNPVALPDKQISEISRKVRLFRPLLAQFFGLLLRELVQVLAQCDTLFYRLHAPTLSYPFLPSQYRHYTFFLC